jgi:hypothetical protein
MDEIKHKTPLRINACIFFSRKKTKCRTDPMLGERKGKGKGKKG